MNMLKWLLGMSSDLDREGKRLVDGVKRAADAFHAFADQVEVATGQKEVPALPAPAVETVKTRRTKT